MLHLLSHGLCGERLANTWISTEQHDETLTFPFDDIVKVVDGTKVAPHECQDHLLVLLTKQQFVERMHAPFDLVDRVDEEPGYSRCQLKLQFRVLRDMSHTPFLVG